MKDNPYKAPVSELVSEEESNRYRPSVGWKLFFWFSIFMFILTILLFVLDFIGLVEMSELDLNYNYFDVFDLVLWAISLFSLYGMAWSRKMLNCTFWLVFLGVLILWLLIYHFVFPFVLEIPTYGTLTEFVDLIYEIPPVVATIYVLYRYVYTMDYLFLEIEN